MPIHDWSRVDAGIFHAFHQQWLVAISNALNRGLLPGDYYALAEQYAAGFGPDVLRLQGSRESENDEETSSADKGGLLIAEPKIAVTAETDLEFYERKQNALSSGMSAETASSPSSRSFRAATNHLDRAF